MAIGERIHFFRIMRGMTQKYLGMLVGFPERSADVRLAPVVYCFQKQRKGFPNGVQMCVWHSTKQALVSQKQT